MEVSYFAAVLLLTARGGCRNLAS